MSSSANGQNAAEHQDSEKTLEIEKLKAQLEDQKNQLAVQKRRIQQLEGRLRIPFEARAVLTVHLGEDAVEKLENHLAIGSDKMDILTVLRENYFGCRQLISTEQLRKLSVDLVKQSQGRKLGMHGQQIATQAQGTLDTCWSYSTPFVFLQFWRQVPMAELPSVDFLGSKLREFYGYTGINFDYTTIMDTFTDPQYLLEKHNEIFPSTVPEELSPEQAQKLIQYDLVTYSREPHDKVSLLPCEATQLLQVAVDNIFNESQWLPRFKDHLSAYLAAGNAAHHHKRCSAVAYNSSKVTSQDPSAPTLEDSCFEEFTGLWNTELKKQVGATLTSIQNGSPKESTENLVNLEVVDDLLEQVFVALAQKSCEGIAFKIIAKSEDTTNNGSFLDHQTAQTKLAEGACFIFVDSFCAISEPLPLHKLDPDAAAWRDFFLLPSIEKKQYRSARIFPQSTTVSELDERCRALENCQADRQHYLMTVLLASNQWDAIEDLKSDDILEELPPAEGNLEGHAMVLDVFQSCREYFVIRNSWGSGFGSYGHFKVRHLEVLRCSEKHQLPLIRRVRFQTGEYGNRIHPKLTEKQTKVQVPIKLDFIDPIEVTHFRNCAQLSDDPVVRLGEYREETVAIKVNVPSSSRELRYSLHHKNIVQVYGYSGDALVNAPATRNAREPLSSLELSAAQVPLPPNVDIIMELCDETLHSWLEKTKAAGKRSVGECASIMTDICNAVIELQRIDESSGKEFIVHCDIKPQNIMRKGKVWKLIDFDAAIGLSQDRTRKTHANSKLGSDGWSDPEILQQEVGTVRRRIELMDLEERKRIDVFSLGRLLEELFDSRFTQHCHAKQFEYLAKHCQNSLREERLSPEDLLATISAVLPSQQDCHETNVSRWDAMFLTPFLSETAAQNASLDWGVLSILQPEKHSVNEIKLSSSSINDSALVELGKYSSLKVLDISACFKLTKGCLSCLKQHAGLVELDISRTAVGDEALAALAGCPQLKVVKMRYCNIGNNAFDGWDALTKLREVDLSNSSVRDQSFATLMTCRKLEVVRLKACNNISSGAFGELAALSELRELDLTETSIDDQSSAALVACTKLEAIELDSCRKLGNDAFEGWAAHAYFRELNTSSSPERQSDTRCVDFKDKDLHRADLFAHLTKLNLARCNQLSDAGLQHLQPVKSLQRLNLEKCKLVSDAGLQHLQSLTSLQHLNLASCVLVTDTGLQHLQPLTSLQDLNLEECKLVTDAGLQHLQPLRSLEYLSLSSCVLITDAGLQRLQPLTSLRHLILKGCKLVTDAGLQHLQPLTSLQHLDLNDCLSVTDTGLQLLQPLTSLQYLCLKGCCRVTDAGLQHLQPLTSLQHLDLNDCLSVTDTGLQLLQPLTSLQHLNLHFCMRITDVGLQHLQPLTSLQYLDLSACKLVTDAGLQVFQPLTSLRHLSLKGCKLLTDAGLQHLKPLTSLYHLCLHGCERVNGAGLQHLRSLTSLRHLSLCGCEFFTDAGLQHLQPLTSLQHLDLSHCELVTDSGLQHLQPLRSLQNLNLGHMRLTDTGLQHLRPLTSLQDLDLSWCELISDAGLQHLRPLTSLQHLCLRGCELVTDAGLQHLHSLTLLQYLDLEFCDLVTDAGLQHLQPLTSLEYLNLASCVLVTDTGLQHLQPLTSLQDLNLEECKLVSDAGLQHLQPLTSLRHLILKGCERVTDAGLQHLQPLASLEYLNVSNCWLVTVAVLLLLRPQTVVQGLR